MSEQPEQKDESSVEEVNTKIKQLTEEEMERQIQEKLQKILKMKDKAFREIIVRDYNTLTMITLAHGRVIGIHDHNFGEVVKFMQNVEKQLKEIQEKLAFLEKQASHDNKRDVYLQ